MLLYKVIKNGVITNQWTSDFADHTYYEECFGKPEHQEEVLDENGSSFDPPQFQTIPSEFEVEIVDITSQLEQEQTNKEALSFLEECDWKRMRHLSQKALEIETSMTEEEYLSMESMCQVMRESIVR